MTFNILLTHDIDYSITGPTREHILAREKRFDDHAFAMWKYYKTSLYYNVHELIKIEREAEVKSTFFFRTEYETGKKGEYARDIKLIAEAGWEIGLHVNDLTNIKNEKQQMEDWSHFPVCGTRSHYLKTDKDYWKNLAICNILYDSSVCFNKKSFDPLNSRTLVMDNVVIFPITIADCFMFSYWNQTEQTLFKTLDFVFEKITKIENPLITIDWHDTSLKMRGGRKYREILRHLKNKGVKFLTGIQAYDKYKP